MISAIFLRLFRRFGSKVALGAAFLLALGDARGQTVPPAPPPDTADVQVSTASAGLPIHLTVGRSRVLASTVPLKRVYVGDPAVVHTFNSGVNEVLVTAKSAGASSLALWDSDGTRYVYSIVVDVDTASLREALSGAQAFAAVRVRANQAKTILDGFVSTTADLEAVSKVASAYSKDVLNNVQIAEVQEKQVELKLRIVEIDRTKLEQFGLNIFSSGNNTTGATTQQFGAVQYTPNPSTGTNTLTFDPLNLLFYSASSHAGVTIRDLEQKDVLQVLAEPTLTTLSGQAAKFLSGGEFPFPVVQGGTANSTAITIMFRPYGVKVDFTPVVGRNGLIRLKINPEVSTLDYSNAVTISGFTIPALSTRRAESEIEIRDGESFMLSGLLDHRATEVLSKVPGIADVPVLGQLFRSKNLNHSVIELVVLVTARILDPTAPLPAVKEPVLPVKNLDNPAFDAALNNPKHSDAPAGKPANTKP